MVFVTSRLFVGGAALALASVAMLACTAQGELEGDLVESSLLSALTEASERAHAGEAQAALGQLMAAAELPGAEAFACEIGLGAAEIADELLDSGDYGEARMGYAVAIYYTRGCDAQLPEDMGVPALALRQRDARETHRWAQSEPGATALD